MAKIDRSNLYRGLSGARVDEPVQPRNWRVVRIEPPGVPIFFLFETARLDQSRVIRRIVRGQHSGRMFKAIDQQPANVVRGIIDRPDDLAPASLPYPVRGGIEQGPRNIDIVDRFKQTKAANIRLVKRVIVRIVARHDSADDFVASLSQK